MASATLLAFYAVTSPFSSCPCSNSLMPHFIQPSVSFNHGIKPPLMPLASLVNKTGYKLSIILPLRNPFGKFFALAVFTHGGPLSILEGAPATHPLYHRGPCQARMKLYSNHKTCSNKRQPEKAPPIYQNFFFFMIHKLRPTISGPPKMD